MHKLQDLLSAEKIDDPPNAVPVKSIFSEELRTLTEKLEELLSKKDSSNYEEMKMKITALIEQFCLANKNKDLVSIDNLIQN